jgi:hypothetical protein
MDGLYTNHSDLKGQIKAAVPVAQCGMILCNISGLSSYDSMREISLWHPHLVAKLG